MTALQAAELPGLLEAVEAGELSSRHVFAVLRELDTVELSLEQRAAIVLVMLARMQAHTPGELVSMVRRLILTVDLPAAQARADKASRQRCVRMRADVDGQGVLSARGPLPQIAAIKACLDTMLQDPPDPGDDRPADARAFDLFYDLLTGGSSGPGRFEVQVLVPVSTAQGGDLEVAEIPGFGALLPSTARDLLDTADALRRITVDADTGQVITVDDAHTTGRPHPQSTQADSSTGDRSSRVRLEGEHRWFWPRDSRPEPASALLNRMLTDPIRVRDLSSGSYRPSGRLIRHLEARDRTCQFPGCHRPASSTDKDHRIPWPRGSTTEANLVCLCRRHHRTKHTSFTLERDLDGVLWWTTRGGQRFPRRPHTY